MALSAHQLDRLLEMLAVTKSEEMDCDRCLDELAAFVERERSSASPAAEIFAQVREHLAACSECNEEYETLLAAVNALEAEGLG